MATGQWTGIGGVARKVKNEDISVGNVAREVKNGYLGVGNVARLFYQKAGVTDITNIVSVSTIFSSDYGYDKSHTPKWVSLDSERTLYLRYRHDTDSDSIYAWVIRNTGSTVSIGNVCEINKSTKLQYKYVDAQPYKISANKIALLWGTVDHSPCAMYSTVLNISDMTVTEGTTYSALSFSTSNGVHAFLPNGTGTVLAHCTSSSNYIRTSTVTINSDDSLTASGWGSGSEYTVDGYAGRLDMRTSMGGCAVGYKGGHSSSTGYDAYTSIGIIYGSKTTTGIGTSLSNTTAVKAASFYNDSGFLVGKNKKIYYFGSDQLAIETGVTLSFTSFKNIFMNISKTKLAVIFSNDDKATTTINFYNINSDHSLSLYHTENFDYVDSYFAGSDGDYFYLFNKTSSKLVNL